MGILDHQKLKRLLCGQKIVRVLRDVYEDEYLGLPSEIRDEEADGQLSLFLSDGSEVSFAPDSENMSVKIYEGRMVKWGDSYVEKDFTNNSFWSNRINQKIISITEISDNNADIPFGIEFLLENGEKFSVLCVSDEQHIDALIIR